MIEMLDLLQLHRPEDNRDARCWILANGKTLKKEIKLLQFRLLKKINRDELINFLAEKAGVKLKIKLNGLSINEWLTQIEKLRRERNISFNQMMKISGTSGEDWTKIQKGHHLPSCKKLNKIAKVIGLKIDNKCNNNDFCLRSIDAIIKSLDSDWIPLVVISGFIDLYEKLVSKNENIKERILDKINKLKILQDNSKPINVIKKIDTNFAKILGAFAADGNYYPPDMLRWEDEYHEQLELLSRWFNESFGIQLKIKPSNRGRNSFTAKFRNKIIGRYFSTFFGYEPKSKVCSVDEPDLIKQQPLDKRKAFASGALMFDGSVNSNGTVTFSVVSKKFRDSIAEILQKDGICLSVSSTRNENEWCFCTSSKLTVSLLKKLSYYFDSSIKKRRIIEFYLGNSKVSLDELKELFPKIRNKINFSNLLSFLNKPQDIHMLMEITKFPRPTLLRYLKILEQANLIKSQLVKHKRFYSPNNWSTNETLSNSIKSE